MLKIFDNRPSLGQLNTMKKFKSFLLCFALVAISMLSTTGDAQAQSPTKLPVVSADTLVNADTTSKVIAITGGFSTISIQPIITKRTGTVAGKVYLYGSVDGTNYIVSDSLTLSDVSKNTAIWIKTPPAVGYYKITAITSGTQNSVLNLWYVTRRYNTQPF